MVRFIKPDGPVLAEKLYVLKFGHFIVSIEISCVNILYHAYIDLRTILDNELHLGFLCENRMVRFGKPECPVFQRTSECNSLT